MGATVYSVSVPSDPATFGLEPREFLEGVKLTDTIISPVGLGRAVETFETAIKGYVENYFGSEHVNQKLLLKQSGLIFQGLPVGNYHLHHETDHLLLHDEIFEQNELYFRVIKHEEAGLHERPAGGRDGGSVICPREKICDDHLDNEGDDLADCDDDDCRYAENCFGPRIVPGRVEAEDYKLGGEGVGYHDSDEGSNGERYRYPDDVDIWSFGPDVFVTPWTAEAEWTAYDLKVMTSGYYTVTARLSCGGGCPSTAKTFSARVAGEVVAFAFDDTGDWINFVDVRGVPVAAGAPGIWLEQGPHVLRIEVLDASDLSLDYFDFVRIGDNEP